MFEPSSDRSGQELPVPECPFCGNRIHEHVFAAREGLLAIYNFAPIIPGHSLVVPQRHVESLMDLTDRELSELFIFSVQIARLLGTFTGSTDFNYVVQNGLSAGQTIPHLHVHVLPRTPADLPHPGDYYELLQEGERKIIDSEKRGRLADEYMENTVQQLRRAWSQVSKSH